MRQCKFCSEFLQANVKGFVCHVCRNGINRYGLNRKQQLALLESQKSKCGICDTEISMFSDRKGGYIDHCHSSNQVRGILCHGCNTFLGYLENKNISPNKISEYLK